MIRPAARPLSRPTFWEALQRTPLWSVALALLVVAGMWLTPLSPSVVPTLLCALIGLGLMLRWPVLGVYALILTVPLQKLVTVSGLTTTQILAGVVLLLWWIHLTLQRGRLTFPAPAVALVFYLGAMALSVHEAVSVGDSFTEMYRWGMVLIAYLATVHLVRTRWEIAGLVISFLLAAVGEAALGLVQTAQGAGPSSFVFADQGTRSYGTIGMPNSFGGYLNLTLPLALALAVWAVYSAIQAWRAARSATRAAHDRAGYAALVPLQQAARRQGALAAGLLVVMAVIGAGVLTSLSRGAWLGLACGLVVMIVLLGRRGLPALIALGAGGLAAVVLGFYGALPAVLVQRLGTIVDQFQVFDVRGVAPTSDTYAQIERLAHWQTAGNMALASPIFGIGIGNFNDRFPDFYVTGWPNSQGHAHNFYLQALAETGVVGLAAYLLLLLLLLGGGIWAVRRVRGLDQALVIGALGMLATFMIHNIFEDLHVLNMGIHWAAVLALFVVVPRAAIADCRLQSAEYGVEYGAKAGQPALVHATRNTQPVLPNPHSALRTPQSEGGAG